MDISVIVPFYNEEGYVEQCVQALLSQDYPKERYEVILVDNNSSDRSAEIVRRYPGIKLLSEGLQGDFAARNRGLPRRPANLSLSRIPIALPRRIGCGAFPQPCSIPVWASYWAECSLPAIPLLSP